MTAPMRWRFEGFEFDEHAQALSRDGASIRLEPRQAQTLAYLCKRSGEVISRDELIEAVWQARAVTDNAVNRVISGLRQALGDDRRAPRFIATLPRKGYRFIAPVEPVLEAPAARQGAAGLAVRRPTALAAGLIGFAAILLIAVSMLDRPPSSLAGGAVALTRHTGQSSHPAVDPAGARLLYTRSSAQGLQLWLRDLSTQQERALDTGPGSAGPGAWSPDSRFIAYLLIHPDGRCEIREAGVEGLSLREITVVHTCPQNSYGPVRYTASGDALILAQTGPNGPPYALHHLDRRTGVLRRLPQPDPQQLGHVSFDIHPDRDLVLLSTPGADQRLELHTLDLETGAQAHLFSVSNYMCCAIWSADGDRVVLVGGDGSTRLLSYPLDGGPPEHVHQALHPIRFPARFPGTEGFLYASGPPNRRIDAYADFSAPGRRVIETATDARAPAVSPSGEALAYLSSQSGREQIWINALQNGDARILTRDEDTPHYFALAWAPDGARLAALGLGFIDVYALETGARRRLDLPRSELRGLSWPDAHRVSFSRPDPGGWRAYSFDLRTGALIPNPERWAYVRHAPDPQDSLWFAQDGRVAVGPDRRWLAMTVGMPADRHGFALVKHGERLVLRDAASPSGYLQALSLATDDTLAPDGPPLALNFRGGFDLGPDVIVVTDAAAPQSNIYVTAEP